MLVIGESPIVRAGLEAAISQSARFEVVGTCHPAESATMLESTCAGAVLVESGTFSGWGPFESGADPKPVPSALTPRETEVLRLLADGASKLHSVLDLRLKVSYNLGVNPPIFVIGQILRPPHRKP